MSPVLAAVPVGPAFEDASVRAPFTLTPASLDLPRDAAPGAGAPTPEDVAVTPSPAASPTPSHTPPPSSTSTPSATSTPSPTTTSTPTPSPSATLPEPTSVPTSEPGEVVPPAPGERETTVTPVTPEPSESSGLVPQPEPETSPGEPETTSPLVGVDWYQPPASHHSGIPMASVIVALVVLVAVVLGFAVMRRHRAKALAEAERGARSAGGAWAEGGAAAVGATDATETRGAATSSGTAADAITPLRDPITPRRDVSDPADRTDDVFADAERTQWDHRTDELSRVLEVTTEPSDRAEPDQLMAFLVLLGEALVDCSSPIAQVQRVLEDVTEVTGHPAAQVIVLPTAVFVTVPGAAGRTVAVKAGMRSLRLDQVEDVLAVAERVRSGRLGLKPATLQLERVMTAPPPYQPWMQVVGYGLYSLGLSLILGGGPVDLAVATLLGLGLGAAQRYLFTRPALSNLAVDALVVLGSAFVVSLVVLALVRWSPVEIGVLPTLVPPLVSYLPGALLTTGVIDLATRQIIAGSSRLASGLMQVVLLAMGVMAAASLVGVRADRISDTVTGLGPVGAWTGVVLFTCGVWLYHCVRTRSMPWVLLVVTVAHAGQVIGGLLFGGVISAFVGAALMMPVALYAATRPSGPPAMLSFLPGFWVLVPGALAVVGLTQSLEDRALGEGTLWTAGGTMVSVSLGVFVGLALWHVAEVTRAAVTGREGLRTPL